MRWSVKLLSPALSLGAAREILLGPDEQGRSARLTISAGGESVEFSAVATGAGPPPPAPGYPEWFHRAHLAVVLNPGHDHATRWLYGVDDAGAVTRKAEWALPGEEPGDNLAKPLDGPPEGEGEFASLEAGGFRARLRLPAAAIWTEGQTVAGMMVKVGFHEECIPVPLCWPASPGPGEGVQAPGAPVWRPPGDAPLGFGDLYPAAAPLCVEEVKFPRPAWGEATWLTIRATLGPGAPAAGKVRAETILPGDSEELQGETPWRASGDRMEVRVPVVFPHRGKWANDLLKIARLRLRIVDEAGRTLWAAEYPFGFDAGIIVRERFGPAGEPLPPRPEPTEADFVDKFRRYLLVRLPDYRWRTTRQGAPSDFYLADPTGQADLDLSDPDWPERVAGMLADRFGRWDDALCAAAMWVYHPQVTRHSSSWSRAASHAAVETIPRLGGCFCGDTARLTAVLAEKIGRRLGVRLRGYTMGLRGHLATLVDSPVGRVVIDGMLGLWFHTLDNARLATLEEMRADRQIVERMWYCPRARSPDPKLRELEGPDGHEFFFGRTDQMIRRVQPGGLVWPEATQ